jgi:hypothetical protein
MPVRLFGGHKKNVIVTTSDLDEKRKLKPEARKRLGMGEDPTILTTGDIGSSKKAGQK